MDRYPNLFSPLAIGPLTVRNRFVSTAQATHFARDGIDSRRDEDYFVAKAKGGVGLIIVGNRLVHPTSTQTMPRFPWGYLRELVPPQRRLTEAVHAHGAAIIAQVNHFGLNGSSEWVDDLRVLWGPSAVRSPANGEIPKAMDADDIRELREWWGLTVDYCLEAGFDGVEVHVAHSYLLNQFLSPVWNKRTDEYGGSFENRFRLLREIVEDTRRRVGADHVVGVRLNVSEYMDGALTEEDAARVAAALEQAGQIDYVNVTAGGYHNLYWAPAPSDIPDGWLVDKIAHVKAALERTPVICVGGLKDAAEAEAIVAAGKADLVAMTRQQIADPETVRKIAEGREDEIIHCIRCNQACIAHLFKGMPLSCTVNPTAGREGRWGPLPPAGRPGRWVVVGGGPAGMKAAATLAARGHAVTLLEQEERLGGQVNLILRTPGRGTFAWIARDLEVHMRKGGVDVRLGTEATPELVLGLAPDGVVVATGALPSADGFTSYVPFVERLPGCDQENVVTAWDVLLGGRELGERVVLLEDDGSRYAAGVAEALLDQGKRVEVVTPTSALFPHTLATLEQGILYSRLFGKGLGFRLNSWARGFSGSTLTVFNLYTGTEETIEGVDTLVLLTAPRADDGLYLALKQAGLATYAIGDCVAPRRLDHAIYEGELAGRELWGAAERYILEGELERWAEEPVGAR